MNCNLPINAVLAIFVLACFAAHAESKTEPSTKNDTFKSEIQLKPTTKNEAFYRDIMRQTSNWKTAIKSKDVDTMLKYALPEYHQAVNDQLRNRNSILYKILLGDTGSFRSLLENTNKIDIALILHRAKGGAVESFYGVTACFYDSSQIRSDSENEVLALKQANDISKLFCNFFFQVDGRWYASYEYGSSGSYGLED